MENDSRLNLAEIPKELRLLLDILRKSNDNFIDFDFEPRDIDWEYFLQLVMHHRVYPIIYSNLKNIHEKVIPPHIFQFLLEEYKRNTFQMLRLYGEMEELSILFSENNIKLLFLKGPVLAAELYGDISLRTSKDLDILIQSTDLKKAEELLIKFGYEKVSVPTVLNEQKWRSHHISFVHHAKMIEVEIHWKLHPPPTKEPSFNELWERKSVSTLTSYPVYFFGKEDLFLYLVAHGARHGWFRLRWLTDIDRLVNKGLDLGKIKFFLKKYWSYNIVGQSLILTSGLLNTSLNEELKQLTERNRSRFLAKIAVTYIMDMEMGRTKFPTKEYLFSLKSKSHKFLFLLFLFYPRHDELGRIKLPRCFHFLYLPFFPFLKIWKRIKRYLF